MALLQLYLCSITLRMGVALINSTPTRSKPTYNLLDNFRGFRVYAFGYLRRALYYVWLHTVSPLSIHATSTFKILKILLHFS